jgi:iron complex transport system substrate-binding protein
MRIVSLLPSATEIVADLGLIDDLVGVSAECKWPADVVGKPVVSAARVEMTDLSSAQIDEIVRTSISDGASLYAVDAALIDELRPDVILTQDLCEVCAVSSDELGTACPVGARIVSLDPGTFGDVAASVRRLAGELGVPERGTAIAEQMWHKARAVETAVAGLPRRRVFVAEWLDPPYCAGHWVPEMVQLAGGVDVLGVAGAPSHPVSWEDVRNREPELVVVAPCGYDADEAARRAVGVPLSGRVVAVDGDGYFSRPGPRLADGVRQLGHLLHPDAVPDPGLPAIELVNR